MHPSRLALIALAGACARAEPEAVTPPPSWVYEPPPAAWPTGVPRGVLGRSQPPQRALASGVVTEPGDPAVHVPLRRPVAWAVPGEGPARAVLVGREGVRPAVELIDVDAGRLLWRETATCTEPVVGVTADAIVCGGPAGTRALGLDGKPRWRSDAAFVAMTDDRVVVAEGGEAVVLEAATGTRRGAQRLPVAVDTVIASCAGAELELFAFAADGTLGRFVAGKPTWKLGPGSPRIAALEDLEPCLGDTILVRADGALVALARATGQPTGRVPGVRGVWHARDGSDRVEVATAGGVASWPRDLAGEPRDLGLPPLGELLDARGDRRLVRASPLTVVVLDRDGVHAYFPLAATSAVLGTTAVVGGGDAFVRLGIPARTRRTLRLPVATDGVAPPAELRDLPAPGELDLKAAIAKPDTGKHAVPAVAIDPAAPAVLYAIAVEAEATETSVAAVTSVDLAARTWRWQRSDGCGPGVPIGLALAADIVACGAQGVTATVRATSRDGATRWEWEGDAIDGLAGGGEVVLVHDGPRLTVLSAATGHVLGRLGSHDGARTPAAVVEVDATTWLVTAEADRLVARLPTAGMLAAWSLQVRGVVRALSTSGEGVLVELEDGDAYRLELRTQTVRPMPGIGLAWQARGELVTGETPGGPIPGIPLPRPVVPRIPPGLRPARVPLVPALGDRNPEAPTLWTPIPPPPPLGTSWQYTLYELGGGVRARNDYALARPVVAAPVRGPTGSPLVVAYGPGLREVLVLDPRTGDPIRRVRLPDGAAPGLVFGTIVEGTPVAGALLAAPLRAVVF